MIARHNVRRFVWFVFGQVAFLSVGAAALAQTLTDPNLKVQTFLGSGLGINQPTGMAFLSATSTNDVFVIEKETGIVKRVLNGVVSTVLDLPVADDHNERGLLGIALHPTFKDPAGSKSVYLYYSRSATDGSAWIENRLERFTWNGTNLVSDGISMTFGTASDGLSNGPNHNGGPIEFGPDGKLYGITGDLNRDRTEQNFTVAGTTSAAVGGIYRLNDNLTVPTDNPFVSHSNTAFHKWYSYGQRNSFGIGWDTFTPGSPRLWDTENGPNEYDEINLVAPGFNSGWEDIMGPDSRDPQGTGDLVNLLAGSTYSDPEFSWLSPVAPTDIHFLSGSSLGAAYNDKVLVADNNTASLYMYTLDAGRTGFTLTGGLADLVADNTTERNSVRVGTSFSVITNILHGPDGYIYLVSYGSNSVFRIVPEPSTGLLAVAGAAIVGWHAARRRTRTRDSAATKSKVF